MKTAARWLDEGPAVDLRKSVLTFNSPFPSTTEEEHSSSKRLEENIPELFSVLCKGKRALTFSPNFLQ